MTTSVPTFPLGGLRTNTVARDSAPGGQRAATVTKVPLVEAASRVDTGGTSVDFTGLLANADEAVNFLKALGHDGRLTILCHLQSGPKSVTELENLLSSRQAVVSQQLARLRLERLVSTRREGQAIYYSLLDPKVGDTIALLAHMFGPPE